MCTMCSYNPVCAIDGSHKAVVEAEALTANAVFSDVTYSTIPGNTSTGENISVGDTILETLETVGDRDWFRIQLDAGDRITFELDGVDHSGSNLGALVDPFVRLYSSAGTFVTGDDDGGPGRNSNLTFTIQNSGTYYVEAAAWDDRYTGDYQLKISEAAALAPGTLTELSDFLVSGYWSTPRYWNLGSTGPNAQNGVLTYTLDGFSEDADGLTAARANLVREAFKMYEAILGIDFQETSSTTADFRFKDNDSGAYAGSSYSISNGTGFISYSRINVAQSWNGGSTSYDSYTFQTILHEIGHALGLGHQGGYNGSASYPNSADFENDSWQASMMSYFSQTTNNSISASNAILISPMTVDWLALDDHYSQYGYGVSNAFTGNTVWGFNTNIAASTSQVFHDLALYADDRAFTIIDSGGIDTLDFSGYSQNQRIDLTVTQANQIKATTSDIGQERENLSLAVGTVIENAISGGGNDTLTGNEVNNSLYGGGGNDTLEGKGGDDLLDGGGGSNDVALFSAAASQYQISQAGTNRFTVAQISGSQDGTDTLQDIEVIRFTDTVVDLTTWTPPPPMSFDGTSGSDNIKGNAEDNIINAYGGSDYAFGGDGSDSVFGGADDDVLQGGNQDDYIDGGTGDDSIDAGSGDDHVVYDAADNPASVTGNVGFDTLVVIDAGLPLSYNLGAGSFEQIAQVINDTSGATWQTRTNTYDVLFRLKDVATLYDDGTTLKIRYDAAGNASWTTAQENYDADGDMTFERYNYDDGTRTDYSFDPDNTTWWNSSQGNFDTAGALIFRRYQKDDGTQTDYNYDTNGVQAWTNSQADLDANGNVTFRRYNNDDGTRLDYTYDTTDEQNWTTSQTNYDTSDRLIFRRYDYDDGTLIDFNYDVADIQSWISSQTNVDASGDATFRRYYNDDGTRLDITYDVENEFLWSQRNTLYDAGGNVLNDVFI